MVPGRTASQCRERWVNVLDTNLNRGKWESEEDEKLITICRQYEGEVYMYTYTYTHQLASR